MTETTEISKLANVLHQNGDKVLNALSKLSLNATLLQKINSDFQQFIECDDETNKFQVLASSNSNSQVIHELHFLHDFIQKTVGLKLTNNANLPLQNNKVDISKFKSIKYLEIKKIPVKEIVGLKLVQSQLESMVCIRCLSRIEELLAECGGDNSSGFVWSELKEAVINYNNIKIVDTSIAFAPWLQVLDLSHNQIVNIKAIECLPNLKYVNLSFNCLNVIPIFNKSARKKMQILILKNNYIEDISGLAGLDYLTTLDVSWNWISTYKSLHPLLTMSTLDNLSMEGNPIYYHKEYKQNVVSFLHINASFNDFMLDGGKLSKYEKSIVGCKLCQHVKLSESEAESAEGHSPVTSSDEGAFIDKNRVKKGGKVRLAVIPNLDDGTYEEIPAEIRTIQFTDLKSTDHLITKKKIEETRAAYGSDNWLRCEAGSFVNYVLGLPANEAISSTPLDDLYLEAALKSQINTVTTQAVIENHSESIEKAKTDSFTTCPEDYPSNYYSVDESSSTIEKKEVEKVDSKEMSPDIEAIQESSEETEDENEKLYLVTKIVKTGNEESNDGELFLALTDAELKEKDSNTCRTIHKWCITSLESCVKVPPNRIQLTFDTVKRDRRERTYELESSEAQEVYRILSQILESRTLQEMNQTVYKCMNCSLQFSVEKKARKKETNSYCPSCNSNLVLEVDEVETPAVKDDSANKGKSETKKPESKSSHNRSSSAGVISGLTGQTVPKCASQSSIDNSGSHSTEISKSSAASLDELNELPPLQNTNVNRSDSDIEILSNPSQSSIEVIDGPSRIQGGNTPGRKRSSEEKQSSQPSLAIPETLPQLNNAAGLTESSSSGSVTDSVCTAYESSNPINRPDNVEVVIEEADAASNSTGSKKCEIVAENNEISDVRHKKPKQPKNEPSDAVQYSYTDFSKIDHRVKLLLYSQIFEDNNEEFSFILRCDVLFPNVPHSFPACIVSSDKKLYILQVTGPEDSDDASKFLQKKMKFDLRAVKSLQVLTWYQGFSVKLKETKEKIGEFLILLKDETRTQSFLKFLNNPDSSYMVNTKIIMELSEKPFLAMQHLLLSGASEDSNIRFFCIFHACSVIDYPDIQEIKAGAILTNYTDLLLFDCEPTWFLEKSDHILKPLYSQKLCNLMSIETESSRIYLQFLRELEEKEEVWDITLKTKESVEEMINAITVPWEEMFLVPLQVSNL